MRTAAGRVVVSTEPESASCWSKPLHRNYPIVLGVATIIMFGAAIWAVYLFRPSSAGPSPEVETSLSSEVSEETIRDYAIVDVQGFTAASLIRDGSAVEWPLVIPLLKRKFFGDSSNPITADIEPVFDPHDAEIALNNETIRFHSDSEAIISTGVAFVPKEGIYSENDQMIWLITITGEGLNESIRMETNDSRRGTYRRLVKEAESKRDR